MKYKYATQVFSRIVRKWVYISKTPQALRNIYNNNTLLKTIRGANRKVKKTERDTHVLAYSG